VSRFAPTQLAMGAALLSGLGIFGGACAMHCSWWAALLVGLETSVVMACLSVLLSCLLRSSIRGVLAAVGIVGTWMLLDATHVSVLRKRLDWAQFKLIADATQTGVLPVQTSQLLLLGLIGPLFALVLLLVLNALKKRGKLLWVDEPAPRALVALGPIACVSAMLGERSLDVYEPTHARALRLLPWHALPAAALPETRVWRPGEGPKVVHGEAANLAAYARYLVRAKDARAGEHAKPLRPLDIVMIHVESLRGDVIDRHLMPNMEKLQERCISTHRHYSTGNNTPSSIFGLLFGLNGYYYPSGRKAQTLAPPMAYLKDAGYTLHAHLTGNLRSFDGISKWFFEGAGMDTHYYENADAVTLDKQMVEGFVASLAGRGEEPHFDYLTVDSTHYDYQYPKEYELHKPASKLTGIPMLQLAKKPQEVENAYKNAVGWVDALLAELFQKVRATGRDKRMLVVVTGDHGESFWEHEAFGHSSSLVDEETRTAFFLCGPEKLSTRYQVSSHADVMPTLLNLVGLPIPFEGWTTGKSLLGYETALDYALLSFSALDSRSHGFVVPGRKLLYADEVPPAMQELRGEGDRGQADSHESNELLLRALHAKTPR
jgi:Sulfatase